MGRHELPVVRAHGELLPDWLLPRDVPWLRELCDAAAVMVGTTRRQATARLSLLAQDPRAGGRGALAAKVLAASLPTAAVADCEPGRLRQLLARAMCTADTPAMARQLVAAQLGLSLLQLQAALLADLPGERLVQGPASRSPSELMLQCNGQLARRLLRRATAAELRLCGHARAVVRQLRLSGVDCEVRGSDADGDVAIAVMPPPPAQQQRLGCALAALLPALPWCRRYRLRARVPVDGGADLLVLGTGDPLPAAREPRRFDSAVERAFHREFQALGSDWQLVREPAAIAVAGALQFPDFALLHRDGRSVLLEIAAYWRPDYLQKKLLLLQAAGERLLLCVDENGIGDVTLPPQVLRFRHRLAAAAVLERICRPSPC